MNAALNKARAAKNDEFYTLPETIAAELPHYRRHFAGKTVYCNCDMPSVSEFPNYFVANFAALRLKRLIATCYPSGRILDYDGDTLTISKLHGNGDFRSAECIALLRQADIVCTNPPFSLFREYVAQLIAEKKKFLIIGYLGAACYKSFFPALMARKVRSSSLRLQEFKTPDGAIFKGGNGVWYSNLSGGRRVPPLPLTATYAGNEAAYPKYDNYDAINIDRIKDIPADYAGVMGVPVTFIGRWNPRQFEAIGMIGRYSVLRGATDETRGKFLSQVNGRQLYHRVLIKAKPPPAAK